MPTLKAMRLSLRARMPQPDVAGMDADLLLMKVLDCSLAELLRRSDEALEAPLESRLEKLAARRIRGEPIAYILGMAGFWKFDLKVGPAVLIPRPDTEVLVETALALLPGDALQIADLGTGSGAVALSLACERPSWRLWATDISLSALRVAAHNCVACNLEHRVMLVAGDWLAHFAAASLDAIVVNPPYVASSDPCLDQGDLRHEPSLALAAGNDGLREIRRIVRTAPGVLKPGGWLILEHGDGQEEDCAGLLRVQGFADIHQQRDLGGRMRVIAARWRPEQDT